MASMNILHYSLGVFPDRQGGLSRYSTDLSLEQGKRHNVIYLIPGKLGVLDKKVRIVKERYYKQLDVYKIENALPIPIYSGIKDVTAYTRPVDQRIYEQFLLAHDIDIIHLHSLMGLHVELLRAANKLRIPTFFTTHDFFGLCPITKLFRDGQICHNTCINGQCGVCSQNAHSYLALAVGQSAVYRKLKNNPIIRELRKKELQSEDTSAAASAPQDCSTADESEYKKLDNYYREIFSKINFFLFNSNQTREEFVKRLGELPGLVYPLVLPSINDHRKERTFMPDGVLRIGFMGESTDFKGFYFLKDAVEKLASLGCQIRLYVYNDTVSETPVVIRKGRYSPADLESIYAGLDLIAVPSLLPETFSFVILEALSFAMPCLISDHVGIKDFLQDGVNGFVVPAGDSESIEARLKYICDHPEQLTLLNEQLCRLPISFQFENHVEGLDQIYRNYNRE